MEVGDCTLLQCLLFDSWTMYCCLSVCLSVCCVCLSVCLCVHYNICLQLLSVCDRPTSFPVRFTNNFGILGVLDYLHGTDVEFRKHISSKRHFTLKGFASAKEIVPDAKEG